MSTSLLSCLVPNWNMGKGYFKCKFPSYDDKFSFFALYQIHERIFIFFFFQILNQHIAQNSNGARPFNGHYPSAYSSRETGYNSGNEAVVTSGFAGSRPSRYHTDPHSESTFLQREEVETEIFWRINLLDGNFFSKLPLNFKMTPIESQHPLYAQILCYF